MKYRSKIRKSRTNILGHFRTGIKFVSVFLVHFLSFQHALPVGMTSLSGYVGAMHKRSFDRLVFIQRSKLTSTTVCRQRLSTSTVYAMHLSALQTHSSIQAYLIQKSPVPVVHQIIMNALVLHSRFSLQASFVYRMVVTCTVAHKSQLHNTTAIVQRIF